MKFGLKSQLNLRIILSTLVIMVLLVFYFSYQTFRRTSDDASSIIENLASEMAAKTTATLNVDLGITSALATSFEVYKGYSRLEMQRFYEPYLYKTLDNNPNYLAFWISLELKYIDLSYKDLPGRITWIYDRLTGSPRFRIEIRDTLGTVPSPQYQEIKRSKSESLIDPYYYNPRLYGLSVDSLLEATVGVPVMLDQEVIGLAGIDLSLEQFRSVTDSISRKLPGSTGMLVSNNGTIVSHPDAMLIGKNVSEVFEFQHHLDEILARIGKGNEGILSISGKDVAGHSLMLSPVKIGSSNTPWSICILTPDRTINRQATRMVLFSMLIGLTGIALLSLIVLLTSEQIIKPIKRTTRALDDLSHGQSVQVSHSDLERGDEIGVMTRALDSLSHRFDAIIRFTEEIGNGKINAVYPYENIATDKLGESLVKMQFNLKELQAETERKDWLKTGINGLNEAIRGEQSFESLSKISIKYICQYVGASVGALYIATATARELRLGAGYAFSKRKSLNQVIAYGEGLVGQCAIEKEPIILSDLPDDYFPVKSATGSTRPKLILVAPCLFNDDVLGVVEIGQLSEIEDLQMEFLMSATTTLAIAINRVAAKEEQRVLLEKTLEQKEELQAQEEELRESNQSLERQTAELRRSEANLQAQQEELRVSNQELEKHTALLEEQSEKIRIKNEELEFAHKEIEQKASDLEIASKYKSEFLANMSHELRTPLNSMLILSQSLAENPHETLKPDEVESAKIIYRSGKDLLNLINEILDLSKIEAGKMSLNLELTNVSMVADHINTLFRPAALEKALEWEVLLEPDCPESLTTDSFRMEQIIKNLVSNSIKFTRNGSIKVKFLRLKEGHLVNRADLSGKPILKVEVSDTGIGIPEDKQKAIFEAFQQADGSTARKYGGTGLGLSISREIARILGGEIQLVSEAGKGSTFSLLIPIEISDENKIPVQKAHSQMEPNMTPFQKNPSRDPAPVPQRPFEQKDSFYIEDDREAIQNGDNVILVIEDDPKFAKILRDQIRNSGFKCIAAQDGESGLSLAQMFIPSAIILDIMLPGIDGWKVLEELKSDTKTRHIPVHLASATDETMDAYQRGAIGFLHKPVTRESLSSAFEKIDRFMEKRIKKVLVIEDNDTMRLAIRHLLKASDIEIFEAGTAKEALRLLSSEQFDCMVLDLGLPDLSGIELLKRIEKMKIKPVPPTIVYTGQEVGKEESEEIQKFARSIIIKGVRSEERLLDEASLFLHRVVMDLPEQQQKIIRRLYEKEDIFHEKKILLVDDDMRNVFALTKVFEEKGLLVKKAENGLKALEVLQEESGFNAILMDIMMPEMDGYETIKRIRQIESLNRIPIIALTAKAMKEDRQKCLDAGASDYIPKPIEIPKLLSMLRVWLSK